jgi:hypothetical protein
MRRMIALLAMALAGASLAEPSRAQSEMAPVLERACNRGERWSCQAMKRNGIPGSAS